MTTTFVELEQLARVRLGGEDVERGAGDLARPDRVRERRLVDELAARGVDDPDAVAHLRERSGVEEAARLLRQRQVEGEEVRGGEDVLGSSACSAPSSRKRSGATNGS